MVLYTVLYMLYLNYRAREAVISLLGSSEMLEERGSIHRSIPVLCVCVLQVCMLHMGSMNRRKRLHEHGATGRNRLIVALCTITHYL